MRRKLAPTFFRAFSLKPQGRRQVHVCLGTACHVRGGGLVLEKFERELGIKAGETTPDYRATFEVVYCLGSCGLAPVAVVRWVPSRFAQPLRLAINTVQARQAPKLPFMDDTPKMYWTDRLCRPFSRTSHLF